jgi:hypothetical protein
MDAGRPRNGELSRGSRRVAAAVPALVLFLALAGGWLVCAMRATWALRVGDGLAGAAAATACFLTAGAAVSILGAWRRRREPPVRVASLRWLL